MRDAILDIWTDLREKRLWPVAVALVLGLLAVPVLLSGGSGEEPAPGALAQPSQQQGGPVVEAADQDAPSSDLGAFDPKDPFKPGVKPPSAGSGTGTVTGPAGPAGASGASGTSEPSAGGSLSAAAGGGGDAPAGVAGAGPSPSGATGSAPAATKPARPRTRHFSYVVDLAFGRTGRERRRRGVKRMTILPDDRHPLLVFLGVTGDRKQAVFLADSSASQSGEGRCRPDVKSCTFIYLSTSEEHDEHFIADAEGREYGLRLLRIRAVEVDRKARSSRSVARTARRSAGDGRRRRGQAKATPFHLPVLLDGLTR